MSHLRLTQAQLDEQWAVIEKRYAAAAHPKTAKAVFIARVRELAEYWAVQKDRTTLELLLGMAHSLLVTLDGCSIGSPGYSLRPLVDDAATEGENIAGDLSYKLYSKERKKNARRHRAQKRRAS